MAAPGFWDDPAAARAVIQQLRGLNGLVKPYEQLSQARDDLAAMAEMAGEDPSFEAEMEGVLAKAEAELDAFELRAMMSGKTDANSAIVSIKPGAGGTDACDWAEILY